jgi:sulfate adenylyltransferase
MNDPLGGVLVDRQVPEADRDARRRHAETLRALPADRNLILDLEKIANGTFSPLRGFLGSEDFHSVVNDMRLSDGTPWTIPVCFHVEEALGGEVKAGDEVAIRDSADGELRAIIRVIENYRINPQDMVEKVYLTADRAHPGVDQALNWGACILGGEVELLRPSPSLIPGGYDLSPAEVRRAVAARGWRSFVGFQTRNVGHRAHEYLQKVALEHVDGILIHPLIGWKKPGDMLPEIVLEGYEILREHYYPRDQVMMAGLTTAMRYAGPREAIFHAIIRKNFGCTHFIIGRDHAGVGGYYEKYAGHDLARSFGDELGIELMLLHGPCWCPRCESIVTEHTCPHEDDWTQISGTEVRAMLARGERPPTSFMRPEVGDFLVARAAENRVFFEG